MKFLADFFPVLLFFGAYQLYDIYVATATAIVASFVQVGASWFRHRKVEKMHLVTLGLLVVFGGLTLALRDPLFIKWKPTVVNWLFAAAFLGSHYVGERPIIQRMMSQAVTLPPEIWHRLSIAWVLFFLGVGAINLLVAFSFSEETWVNFKLFGMLGLTILFVIGQAVYLAKHMKPQADATQQPEQNNEA